MTSRRDRIDHHPLPRAGGGRGRPSPLRIPLQPLLECMTGSTMDKAFVLRIHHRQLYRLLEVGVTVAQADELAVRIQIHPSMIWDEWEQIPIDETELADAG